MDFKIISEVGDSFFVCSKRKDNSEKPPEDRIPKFSFSKQLIPSLTQVNWLTIINTSIKLN